MNSIIAGIDLLSPLHLLSGSSMPSVLAVPTIRIPRILIPFARIGLTLPFLARLSSDASAK